MEVAYKSSRTCHKVRVAELERGENDKSEREETTVRFLKKAWNVIDLRVRDISSVIVVLDYQLQGEAHNTDLLNEMYKKKKTKNSWHFGACTGWYE